MARPTTSGGPAPGARRHRWPRRVGIALLALVAGVVVLALGALAYLATPPGGERLRRLVVEKANAAIAGTLAVQELSLRGGHLTLRGVELRDPDGDAVASASALELRLRLAALLRKRVDLAFVRIEGPEISVEQDEDGNNLQRAVAARNPAPHPEKANGQKSGVGLVLEDLEIDRGVLDVVQRSPGPSRHVHLDDFTVRGAADMVAGAIRARLTIHASFAAPFEGPLDASLEASGAGPRKDVRLSVRAGAAKVVANAHAEDDAHAYAVIESLVAAPDVVRAFAPAYPLRATVSATGVARRNGDEVTVRLDARAASATARVDADLDVVNRRTQRTVVAVRHVDLSELTEDGPASDIALGLTASGGGASFDDLAGRLELSVPPSAMAGETMGPVHVVAIAKGGELQVPELVAVVPGLRVEGRGRVSRARLALRGRVVARDLAAFSRTVGKLVGPNGLSVKGQGRLAFALAGSAEHPSVRLDGSFPVLVREKARVDGLSVHVRAPDLKSPSGVHAHVAARALALQPDKVFRAVRLDADGTARQLSIDAAAHGYAEVSLAARAALSPGGRRGTLHVLTLRYPEAQWSLEAPAAFESRPGLLRIEPLTLRSGTQAISASVLERGATLDAVLALRSFDLAKLPKALLDPRLGVGGLLDVELHAEGPSSRPDIAAKLQLQRARFKKYRQLRLRLDASYADGSARGEVAAKGEGIELAGTFDLPLNALKKGRRVPVKAELRIPELRLDESLRQLGIEEPISGTVSAQLSLRGTADDPRLRLSFRGRNLRVKELAPADLDLALASAEDGALAARLDVAMEGRKSFLEARTPFRLGPLLRRPPRRRELLSAAYALDADVRGLPLRLLSEAGITSRPLRGAVNARAHLAGPAVSPRGHVSVDVKGLATESLKPLDARVRLQVGDEVRGELRAEQGGKSVFMARASVGARPRDVQDTAWMAQAPLSVEAHVGPLSLSELQAATQPAEVDPAQAPPRIRGTLAGRLSVSGTLRDPAIVLRTRVDGLGAEETPEGQVTLSFDYRNARETMDLVLRSQNGGALHASAGAGVDLSYPAVTRARIDAAPVHASLQANDFDPAFLSKMGGALDKLGGLLYADARVSGTMGSPSVKGRVEWKKGLLSTHGSGDFTDIHLLATGDNDRLELKELTARSGSGTAKLSAVATRTGAKAFRLHAAADLDRFPVTSQGQVAATVSIRSTVDGDASPARVTLKTLDIPEAHVQLPDVQRKDVQKLNDPPDVVLTVRGKPVHGGTAERPASAAAESGATASGAAAGSPAPGRPRTQIAIFVNAPRNLWIQGKDVNTEIGLSDGFRVEYASGVKVFGDVNVIRGRLDVFGRRFDFQRDSKVSFTGPVLGPDLDVTAAYKNEIEQVTVYLRVQGQGQKLQLQPTSDPPLPETEIYTLLATGHTSLHHGSGASSPSGEAASLVGSLAASQLKKTLSGKLPLDVLSIEAGDSGIAGSKLEAGTYVNDRLYLGFTGRLGADPMRGENSNEVDVEYQLSKHWSVDGSYGDAHAGGASVNWRTDY